MKLFAVSVAAALGVFGMAKANAATSIACVGDSITQNSGWTDRLATKLGATHTVTNFGISGTTLLKNGDSPYWNTTAYTRSHTSNPAIVVIMLGTNDSKPFNWNAHKGEFAGDYEALIDSYNVLPVPPKIYLALCPPAGTNGFQISGAIIENEILPIIQQVAAKKGVGVIDVFTAFGGHNFSPALFGSAGDQVHPGGAGAQRIADTVYAAVAPPGDGGVADAAADAGRDGARADGAGADGGQKPADAAPEASAAGSGGMSGRPAGGGGTGDGTGGGGNVSAGGTGGGTGGNGGGGTGGKGSGGNGAAGSAGNGGPSPRAGASGCAFAPVAFTRDTDRGSAAGAVLGLIVGAWLWGRGRTASRPG